MYNNKLNYYFLKSFPSINALSYSFLLEVFNLHIAYASTCKQLVNYECVYIVTIQNCARIILKG